MVSQTEPNLWETFLTPKDLEGQEPSFQMNEQQDTDELPQEKESTWADFKTPETYQGEIDPEQEESTLGLIARNITQLGSRVAEQSAGIYGNIEKTATGLLANAPKSAGLLGWGISQLVGEDKWKKLIEGKGQMLPTSGQLREASEKATKDYTKPKGKAESAISETIEDISAVLRGGGRTGWMKNLGIPVLANTAKQVVQETGFGEDKANIAKAAVWLPMMLADSVNGPRYASNLMNMGRNQTPQNMQFDIPRMQARLNAASQNPLLLQSDPRSLLARQQLAALQNDLQNGLVTQRGLMTAYDGINAAKRSRALFEFGRGDQNYARRAIDTIRDAVGSEIRQSGARTPQALNNWQNGLTAWATIHRSNAMTGWIQSQMKGPYAKFIAGPAAALLGLGTYGGFQDPLIAGTTAAATAAAYKTYQIMYRSWNNPTLRNYYFNSINAANAENFPAFLSNYRKLNDKLEIEEERLNKLRQSKALSASKKTK